MGFLKPETAAKLEGRAAPAEGEQLAEEGSDPTPTAPPIGSMASLPGYEGLDFTGGETAGWVGARGLDLKELGSSRHDTGGPPISVIHT